MQNEEDDDRADEISHNNGAGGGETEALLPPRPPAYLNLRVGRESQRNGNWTRFVLAVFKVCFSSLGLWGHHAWNYIPRILFVIVCGYQTTYRLFIDSGCLDFDCHYVKNSSNSTIPHKEDVSTGNAVFTIVSMAADISYVVFLGSFVVAKRMDSALVDPSHTLTEDLNKTDVMLLFLAFGFVITAFLALGVSFYEIPSNNEMRNPTFNIANLSGTAAQLLVHWSSINTCHIFAVSSVTIGKLASTAKKIYQTLDESSPTTPGPHPPPPPHVPIKFEITKKTRFSLGAPEVLHCQLCWVRGEGV